MPFLPGDVYTDVPLTQAAIKRFQKARAFIARKAAPRMPVNKLSGSYKKWKMGDFNRNEMEARGHDSPPRVAKFGHEPALFAIQARSLAYNLNDWTKAASDVAIDPSSVIPTVLAYKAALNLEILFSSFAFSASNWFRNVTGAASDTLNRHTAAGSRKYWNDSSADPIKAIRQERNDQGKLTGFRPNAMIFGADLFEEVAMHPTVRATLSNGSTPILRDAPATAEEIARLCDLQWVGVSSAIYNTALEGETPSNDYIIPTGGALLYYRGDESVAGSTADDIGVFNPEMPSAMARCQWEKAVGNAEGFRIRSYRDEDAGPGGSEKSVADSAHDFVSVTSEMGTLFTAMIG